MSSTKTIQITLTIPSNFELAEPTPRPPRKGEWYLDWDEEDVTVCQAKSTKEECFCFPILRPKKDIQIHKQQGPIWFNTGPLDQTPNWQYVKYTAPKGFEILPGSPRSPKKGEWFLLNSKPIRSEGDYSAYTVPILKPTMKIPYGFKLKEPNKRIATRGEYFKRGESVSIILPPFSSSVAKVWILELDPPKLPEGWEFAEEAPRPAEFGEYFYSRLHGPPVKYTSSAPTKPVFILRETWTPPASCPKGTVFTQASFNKWQVSLPNGNTLFSTNMYNDFTPPPYSPYTVS